MNNPNPIDDVTPDEGPDDAPIEKTTPTALDGDDTGINAPSDWPENWQGLYAGEDEKKANVMSRFASPAAAFDALIAAQDKIHSGNLKEDVPFPKDGTDEEKAEWRQAQGIPNDPKGYEFQFDDGLVFGEEDEAALERFKELAHNQNIPPEQAKAIAQWYYQDREVQEQQRAESDDRERIDAITDLKKEWGSAFKGNINAVQSLLDMAPEGVSDMLQSARDADGKSIFNDANVLRYFAHLANEINPVGAFVPPGGGDAMETIATEIASIEKTMRTNRSEYNKDEAMQARYRELLDIRQKMQQKGKG